MFLVEPKKRKPRGRHLIDSRKAPRTPTSTPQIFDARSTVKSVVIGRNIAKWRIKRKLSQRALGKMIHIPKHGKVLHLRQNTVARIEAGFPIREGYVRLFAEALKIKYEHLIFKMETPIKKFPIVDFQTLADQGDEKLAKFFGAAGCSPAFKQWLRTAIFTIKMELIREQDRVAEQERDKLELERQKEDE